MATSSSPPPKAPADIPTPRMPKVGASDSEPQILWIASKDKGKPWLLPGILGETMAVTRNSRPFLQICPTNLMRDIMEISWRVMYGGKDKDGDILDM